ncbi:hypothetical protein C8Z91_34820 [Paenibacillus elgii]|uniref:Glycosyltransferase subfamily 4-like N-terminal domain-containing protein n=1 Tax=Paenibacillus elgii TaxID=189691 RepID=A0A2T6FRU6_9BACL|nr:hypothetical protein [Paenibacillus elgii]PUA34641.1 hypothetical protein C8Z91_34820 [Paenibacillus elgii]
MHPKVCMFLEATMLPSYEGATQRFTNLSYHLARQGYPTVIFHVYRGWSDLNKIRKQPYRTYIVEPSKFYDGFDQIIALMEEEAINIVQFSDYERILMFGSYIKKLKTLKYVMKYMMSFLIFSLH